MLTDDDIRAAIGRLLDPEDGIGEGTVSDYVGGGFAASDAVLVAQAHLALLAEVDRLRADRAAAVAAERERAIGRSW